MKKFLFVIIISLICMVSGCDQPAPYIPSNVPEVVMSEAYNVAKDTNVSPNIICIDHEDDLYYFDTSGETPVLKDKHNKAEYTIMFVFGLILGAVVCGFVIVCLSEF